MTTEEEKISYIDDSPIKETEQAPLQILEKLLSIEDPRKIKNRLIEDFKYEYEGSNGLFEATPRFVKIGGFEINKKITTKITLVNKSKYSERVIILPPKSPFFKIRYSKRGQISPGLSEIIYLIFHPTDYQVYEDEIRINCPGDNITIKICAYPRMNIFKTEYIPKTIELGNITLDTTYQKEISLDNLIDNTFEYLITPIKPIEEISITPLTKDIKPCDKRSLIIKFTPKKYGFFRGEYEFRVNEHYFTPYVFSIIGECNTFGMRYNTKGQLGSLTVTEALVKKNIQKNVNPTLQIKEEEQKNPEQSIIVDKSQQLPLGSSSDDIKISQDMDNQENETQEVESLIKKNDDTKSNVEQAKSIVSRPMSTSKALQKYKDFPSNKEREYLNYYNNAEGVIQSKEFKYIPFIGKELLTPEQTNKLLTDRENDANNLIDSRCQMDKNRHQIENDRERCEVDKDLKFYLKPNFNSNQNDNFFKTRHYFKQFLKGMTKVIIRRRAEKNMNCLKNMLDSNNIKTREDFKSYVNKNWIEYYSKDQRTADDETSFNFLKMKFIAPTFLFREQVYLTNEYSIDSLKQQITHENNINLEEYVEYDPLERHDLEVIGYSPFVSPGCTQFDINLGEKIMRPGCEAENLIRDERGDTEMSYDKLSSLLEISEEHLKHIDFQAEDILFNNPSLKRYVPLNSYTENSIDYNLQPRKLQHKEELITNYLNELYMKTNLSYCDNGQINLRQIDQEYLLCDHTLNFMPKRLKAPDQKDLNVKREEKVDEDNYIYEFNKEDENQLLDMIEKDDEIIQKMRQLNKNETIDMKKLGKISMEKDMQMQKKKWMSTVPTMFEYYNSGIVNPNNKFLL